MANLLARFAGKVCEVLLPVKHDIFLGSERSSVAVCTLSSIDLLGEISRSKPLMKQIALAGRLFSENKGIEKLIRRVLEHRELRYIVLCGSDTKAHLPGQSLLALVKNGIDANGRIVGAKGKDPVLEDVSREEVEEFRRRITIIDLIGSKDIGEISAKVASLVRA
ncbi:MAG: tetrahydromethanopterin S-methyltransferase subunit A [Nitrososphaerales archaeon]